MTCRNTGKPAIKSGDKIAGQLAIKMLRICVRHIRQTRSGKYEKQKLTALYYELIAKLKFCMNSEVGI